MTKFLLKSHAKSTLARFPTLLMAVMIACLGSTPALAQTDTFIAGSGNWSPPANWSLGQVPGQGNDCVLPDGSTVTSDIGGECANFNLGGGGSLTVTPGYLFVYGTSFVNRGTITVGSGNGLDFAQQSVTATMTGKGTINLTASSRFTGFEDTVINDDNTIRGQGYIDVMQFTNHALIDANITAAPLELHADGNIGIVNTATIQASNGGTLQLTPEADGVPFNNTGGVIQALDGSVVQLNGGYVITGGRLITKGTGIFQENNITTLNNLTSNTNFQIASGGNVTVLQGAVINNGTFQALTGGFQISGSAILKGTGKMIGGTGQLLGSNTIPCALLNQITVQGGGGIGDNYLTITNQGTINANDTSSSITTYGPNALTNTALMEATGGGTLTIENVVNNKGGTIQALDGSTVLLAPGTINGGTLKTSGSGVFDTTSGTLDGTVNVPTNAGLFRVHQGTLSLQGTINNTGTIALDTAGFCVGLTQPTILTGSGKVTMAPNTCFLGYATTNTLTNQSTIEGAGSIGDSNPMGITNDGTIIANQSTSLTIAPDTTLGFTNAGTLLVNSGSELDIEGTFNNLPGTTLTGGTYSTSGILGILNGNIITNAAHITLTGASAEILNVSANQNALLNLAVNAAKGVLSLQGGQILSIGKNLSSKGVVTVGANSGLTVGGNYTQMAGTTTVDGALMAAALKLQKGSLLGAGAVAGAVNSSTTVEPGDSSSKPGILSLTGTYTQDSTGNLNISIGGTTVGKQYSQLAVSNGAKLNGTLDIKLIKGFVPTVGETFTILTSSAVSGKFATVNGLRINSSEHFDISYTSTAVTLKVVSGA